MDSFFGIGAPELILILVIAGMVMGPERIAHIARWLGKTTAQLQSISRSFLQQLNQELDGVDDGGALKDALSEMQSLRKELENLKGEFVATTQAATNEGKSALKEVEAATNSILPPSLLPPATENNKDEGDGQTAVSPTNSKSNGTPPTTILPTPLEISDDPD